MLQSRQRSVKRLTLTMIVATSLLFLSYFPLISTADPNGGLSFDSNAVSFDGDGDIGEGPLWINLTVVESIGNNANGTISAELSTIEGNPVSVTQEINAAGNTNTAVSLFFPNVAVGLYTLELNLTGDIDVSGLGFNSTSGANWTDNWIGLVSKLRPLSVGLAATGQWDLTSYDANGNETTILRDGDNISIEVPVVNLGDVNASGNLSWNFDGGQQNILAVETNADETEKVVLELGIVSEGEYSLSVSIDFTGDSDSSDNTGSLQITVNPPPLPRLQISLDVENSSEIDLGDIIDFVASVSNDGESEWSGDIVCTSPNVNTEVYNDSVTLQVGEHSNLTISITATPGTLECTLKNGGRIAEDSNHYYLHEFDMAAAEFSSVGGGNLSILGGPWHVGDTISTNIIVYNAGDLDGSAVLNLRQGINTSTGFSIDVTSGSSALIEANTQFTQPGIQEIQWWVSSLDGSVDTNLSGQFNINVQDSQSLITTINSINWDATEGLSVNWNLDLSSGLERVVAVEIGIRVDGIDDSRQTYDISLSPGLRTFDTELGIFNGQGEVYISIIPEQWYFADDDEVVEQIPTQRPDLQLGMGVVPIPTNPVTGDSAAVTCVLSNGGSAISAAGVVRLLDSDGLILDEKTSNKLQPSGSSTKTEMEIDSWPDENVVNLRCWWRVGEEILITESSYISGEVIEEEKGMMDSIPIVQLLYGVIVAIVITLMARLGYGWKNADPSAKPKKEEKPKEKKDKVETKQVETSASEKHEVSCPSCAQRLSVPTTFSGTVRCPSCRNEFAVEGEEENSRSQQEIESIEEPESADEELIVTSSDDILSCPKCESKLRVAMDKRPVRARCPACKVEFMAHSD